MSPVTALDILESMLANPGAYATAFKAVYDAMKEVGCSEEVAVGEARNAALIAVMPQPKVALFPEGGLLQ